MEYQRLLNDKQYEAVSTKSQHVRIVAGAGSGKTRVLTYRIAYLMDRLFVTPDKILAFTFTNKVAKEMHDRVVNLLGFDYSDLKIKTFHSFAAYFLRLEIHNIDFPSTFTILDEDESLTIIKDCALSLGYSKKDEIIKKAYNFISSCKLEEKYPADVVIKSSFKQDKDLLKIYELYEEHKDKMYALDFDDLLLNTIYILKTFPRVRYKWQDKFDHILVDEFQDTNDTEFNMIRLLKKEDTSLYVVGDPDQTIYTWRGANQDIILRLESQYPDIETIILNENYRSTQKILSSANSLISYNRLRIKKDLFTRASAGDAIVCRGFNDFRSEANYAIKEILRLKASNRYSYSDFVILYRSSYVSQDFEKALVASKIPYRIYGGIKFYQRKEIKDVLAYMRVIANENDDSAFERIINAPKRGVGETSIAKLKHEASVCNLSLYQYINSEHFDNTELNKKAIDSLKTLVARLNILKKDLNENMEAYSTLIETTLSDVGYYNELKNLDDGEERMENVKQLFQDMRIYLRSNPDSKFSDYLQDTALLSAQDDIEDGDYVTLMTAHTAKGLEYPVVFVVRFNEGIFPHIKAFSEGEKGLEEERRLAYVAFTRAKERLYVTYVNGAYSYTVRTELAPSQFIKQAKISISNEPVKRSYSFSKEDDMFYVNYHSPYKNKRYENEEPYKEIEPETNDIVWKVGDMLEHKTFGKGIVVSDDGDGIITVNFENHGLKSLMGNHKFLKKI